MKVVFKTQLQKFQKNAEKTGWTYFIIPQKIAEKLNKGVKKSFRVKGFIDEYEIKQVSILPYGGGDFIMAFNAAMRKGTQKKAGDSIALQLEADHSIMPV